MKDLKISLTRVDQSCIITGDVSLSHIVRMHGNLRESQLTPVVNGTTLRSLRIKGVRKLKDIGHWIVNNDGGIILEMRPSIVRVSWSTAAQNGWMKLMDSFHHKLKLHDLVASDISLTIPRELRQTLSEHSVLSFATASSLESSKHTDGRTWASDSSMLPATANLLDEKSVVGAATGLKTLALKLPGRNISILHGELVGLIIGLILSGHKSSQYLLSDHLNSVRLIDDSQTGVSQIARMCYMNSRSYYRWILDLISRSDILVRYTPGHSNDESLDSKMNNEADLHASSSQKHLKSLPIAPVPTFTMNEFTFHSEIDGWIECNVPRYIDARLSAASVGTLRISHGTRMSTWAHDQSSPPDYPYLRATSAYSIAIQLYARSGQLPTADLLKTRKQLVDDTCRLCCGSCESVHHLFIYCPFYGLWQDEAAAAVLKGTSWTSWRLMALFGTIFY